MAIIYDINEILLVLAKAVSMFSWFRIAFNDLLEGPVTDTGA